MSVIKTITAKFIERVLKDDFKAGVLVQDDANRDEAATINPDDVQELIDRLKSVVPVISPLYAEHRKEAAAKALDELKKNEQLKALLGDFGSLDELLAAAGASTKTSKSPNKDKATSSSSSSNNKRFTVRWNITDKVTNETEQVEYTINNFNVDPEKTKIGKDEFFINWMKKNKNNLHDFMLTYSDEYKAYCKNEYKGKRFFMPESGKGKMNPHCDAAYTQWKEDKGITEDTADNKKQFYKETLVK
nr:hypothetical protein [uncultured Rahnella sp.]